LAKWFLFDVNFFKCGEKEMKEDVTEPGVIQETVELAQLIELADLQLSLAGGGFGEVVLV
jgi:hypothetical protein